MTDMTEVRDAIARAVEMTRDILAERKARGYILTDRDDAFRLFYWAMMEVSEASDGNRDLWLRSLLAQTDRPYSAR